MDCSNCPCLACDKVKQLQQWPQYSQLQSVKFDLYFQVPRGIVPRYGAFEEVMIVLLTIG